MAEKFEKEVSLWKFKQVEGERAFAYVDYLFDNPMIGFVDRHSHS